MKLKTVEVDGKTYAEVQDGHPVYIHDDGKEAPFDAKSASETITARNGEAMRHRENLDEAKRQLKAFEGIDPAAAKKALETVRGLDEKKLIDAGDRDAAIAAAVKAAEQKYAPIVEERDRLQAHLDREIRGGSFARSKFAEEKVTVPRHMLERTYGDNFKIEDGKLVPYDAQGNKIYSRTNPGQPADFDEALEIIINADPYKDHILKGEVKPGGGAPQGQGGGGTRTMKESDFLALPAKERAAKMAEGTVLV
jgi:hypothetical protein